jgi:hypothetical protein
MKSETNGNIVVDRAWLGIPLCIAACIPWVSILLTYSLAAYVRLSFGRWPVAMIDSVHLPLLIECFFPYVFVFVIMSGFVIVPIFASIWIPLCFALKARQHLLVFSAILAIGWSIEALLVWADPWGFIAWYGD